MVKVRQPKKKQPKSMLDWARFYVQVCGFSVIPLYPHNKGGLKEQGKKPMIPWEPYQTRPPTDDELVKWHKQFQGKYNLGIVTGPISGFDVLDFDTEQAKQMLKELPKSPTSKTGKPHGYHWLCKHNPALRNRVKIKSGFDVRAEGGFIVAPPSIHKNGKRYQWIKGREPWKIGFAEIPNKILQEIKEARKPVDESPEGFKHHERDVSFFHLARKLWQRGNQQWQIEAILKEKWERTEQPYRDQFTWEEVLKKIEQAKKYVNLSEEEEEKRFKLLSFDELVKEAQKQDAEHGNIIKIGFPSLDKHQTFAPGRLMLIAGETSMGKTALGFQVLTSMALRFPVGLVSIEMSERDIMERYGALQMSEKQTGIIRRNLISVFPPACSLSDLEGVFREMKERYPQLKVILVDYLQLMRERNTINRHEEVSLHVRGMKSLAKELDLGVIAVCQLSRRVSQRSPNARPALPDLKESGDLEYTADVIIFVWKEHIDAQKGELILAKNRQGRAGTVEIVNWNPEKVIWQPAAPVETEIEFDSEGNAILKEAA